MLRQIISSLPIKLRDRYRSAWISLNNTIKKSQDTMKALYVKALRFFSPAPIPSAALGKVYLHLGCGKVNHPKFINIDGLPHSHVHYVQRIDKLKRFSDESVDLIYASHCLEHFHYNQTEKILREWFRVLHKGSILRLSVPDFDLLLRIYSENDNDPDVILPQLLGGQNNKYNFHYTALNIVNLSRMLRSVGFRKIRKWTPGQGDLTTFDDFSTYRKEANGNLYEVSLNIEAEK